MSKEKKLYTVTQINHFIKKYIEREPFFSDFWIKGEISTLKYHSSGHIYFTLKDKRSEIRGIIFRYIASKLKFKLKDGMQVFCRCELSIYTEGGSYSLKVKEVEEVGQGELYKKFIEIKEKLEKEGLFNKEHKKEVPSFCLKVAVITSRTGAVIRDIIRVIKRRAPWVQVYLFPAQVQGPSAAGDIIRALKLARSFEDMDAIIVGRGGGSMEDLWCFNDETLAREIFETAQPVISAVGHEIDWTIADFISDRRAATPTEAAEFCTPDKDKLIKEINQLLERGSKSIQSRTAYYQTVLDDIENRRYFKDPMNIVKDRKENTDSLYNRLAYIMANSVNNNAKTLSNCLKILIAYSPSRILKDKRINLEHIKINFIKTINEIILQKKNNISSVEKNLQLLGPYNILKRGYSIMHTSSGDIVKSVEQVKDGEETNIKVYDGNIKSKVIERLKD